MKSQDPFIQKHLNRIYLIYAALGKKKLFVECMPTDKDAQCFPNSNRAVKEVFIDESFTDESQASDKDEEIEAPVPGKEEVYRELLIEIDKALYIGDDLTDEDILKWYIDVITTIKDEIKETLAPSPSTKQSNEDKLTAQEYQKLIQGDFDKSYDEPKAVQQAAKELAEKRYQTTSMSNQIHRMNMEEDRKIFIDGFLAGASFNSDAVEKTNDEFCICMFRTTSIKGERCGYCLKIVNG